MPDSKIHFVLELQLRQQKRQFHTSCTKSCCYHMNGRQFSYNCSAIWGKVHSRMVFPSFLHFFMWGWGQNHLCIIWTFGLELNGPTRELVHSALTLLSNSAASLVSVGVCRKRAIELVFSKPARLWSALTLTKTPLTPCFMFLFFFSLYFSLLRALLNSMPVRTDTREERAKRKWKQQASGTSLPHILKRINGKQWDK